MLPSSIAECLFSFTIFLLILEVQSSKIPLEDEFRISRSSNLCDANSDCLRIGQCNSYKLLENWRTVGKSCNDKFGNHRKVCCPKLTEHQTQQELLSPEGTTEKYESTITTEKFDSTITTEKFDSTITTQKYESTQKVQKQIALTCGQQASPKETGPRKAYAIGSENVTEGAFPWMVAITKRVKGRHTPWCTGFLIDRKHVISAAHCFGDKTSSRYIGRIGSVNQDEGEVYRFNQIYTHEKYRKNKFFNDLAILTLNREVDFGGFNPICLPDKQAIEKAVEGQGTTVAGWGSEKEGGNSSITLKQLSGMPIVSNSNCNKLLHSRVPYFRRDFPKGVTKRFLCAGFQEGGKDSCSGDSGGPLMMQDRNRWFAIGVVSFGFQCGRREIPGGYIRVSEYLKWIEKNTKD